MKIEAFTVHLCVVNAVRSRPFFLDERHRKLSLHPSTACLFHYIPCDALLCCAVLCRTAPRRTVPCPCPCHLVSCRPRARAMALPCLGRLGQIEPVVPRRIHCLRLSSA